MRTLGDNLSVSLSIFLGGGAGAAAPAGAGRATARRIPPIAVSLYMLTVHEEGAEEGGSGAEQEEMGHQCDVYTTTGERRRGGSRTSGDAGVVR